MVRVQELKRLQIQASADPSVFTPELIQSVLRLIRTNPEPTVRAHAAGGLRGATSPEFRQAMIGLLQSDPSAGVRQSAADALAPANGHADVREALSRALERETEVHVRDQIRRSLNYVAPVDRLRKGS
jgi:HEAT repeat protein